MLCHRILCDFIFSSITLSYSILYYTIAPTTVSGDNAYSKPEGRRDSGGACIDIIHGFVGR